MMHDWSRTFGVRDRRTLRPVKNESKEVVFMVRMWEQGGDDVGKSQWRGSIQDIASGQRFYVTGTRDVADFIDARIAERAGDAPRSS